jgi:hypothetical protein
LQPLSEADGGDDLAARRSRAIRDTDSDGLAALFTCLWFAVLLRIRNRKIWSGRKRPIFHRVLAENGRSTRPNLRKHGPSAMARSLLLSQACDLLER